LFGAERVGTYYAHVVRDRGGDATLTFVLPDGRRAIVPELVARRIADELWDLGIRPGAAVAAARIVEALRSARPFCSVVKFDARETVPLLGIAEGVTWLRGERNYSPPNADGPAEKPGRQRER
jgi:hypothetical protein